MGIFKDYGNLKKEVRKIKADNPGAGVRLREMNQKMADLNASMVQTAAINDPAAGSVAARVQLVSCTPTTASVNGQPLVDLAVTVLAPGLPPIPATARVMVPATSLYRLQPGTTLAARIDPSDPAAFAIDWNAPA